MTTNRLQPALDPDATSPPDHPGVEVVTTALPDVPLQKEAGPNGACCTTTSTDSGPCCAAGVQES